MKKFNQFIAEANICPVCNSEPCTCPGGDNHITESDAAWAAAEAKRKEQEAKKALTKKDASTVDKIRAMMAKEKMKEEVEIEEANTPSDADLHKTLGPTKNMQQGVEALKKKHGMSDDEAKKHVRRLMGMKEETEQLDELSPGLLGRYTRARGSLNITKKQSKMKALAHQKMRDKTKDMSAIAGKYSNPADLTKTEATTFEETEQIDELSKGTLRSYIDKKSDDHESNRNAVADARDALRKHQRNKPSLDAPLKQQLDHSEKKRELEKDVNAASRTATRSNVNILKAKKRLNKEEVTMNEAKDEQEYGYEGAMAMTQLKTLTRHAEHMMGMMKEDTDLPEWVQSKITLATDYVQTAHDYLMSEMNEEVEENYVSHAQRKAVWAARNDEKMKKEDMHTDKKEDPPFDGPYSKKKIATPGKQGYGMSAARHLARQALQKVADKQKNK